jgi:hypothetical protein
VHFQYFEHLIEELDQQYPIPSAETGAERSYSFDVIMDDIPV